MTDNTFREKYENKYSIRAPISISFDKTNSLMEIAPNFMIMILAISCFLADVVTNPLIKNQMNAKTYENAMLRCLGW
jgi:hypothetical protein